MRGHKYTDPQIGNCEQDEARFQAWAREVEREMAAAMLARVPDPREVAMRLPLEVAEALVTALPGKQGYEVSREAAKLLMPWGLCEAGTKKQRYCLSNFGRSVLVKIKGDFA